MSYQQYRPTNFNILPLVVKNLFIINGLFLLATVVFSERYGIDMYDTLGLHLPNSENFQPYQFVTYMFMHADGRHLFSNMFSLWLFGSIIENYWGSKKFLIYYMITGIGAACIHYLIVYYETIRPVAQVLDHYSGYQNLNQFMDFYKTLPNVNTSEALKNIAIKLNSAIGQGDDFQLMHLSNQILYQYKIDFFNLPLIVGASGSVFGVLLAFGMLFPNMELYSLFPIKAKWIVLMYGIGEFASGIVNDPNDKVAHFAHLGGMLFGFILIKYWQKTSKRFY
jgi:membrane associated rhomboid family serine protease